MQQSSSFQNSQYSRFPKIGKTIRLFSSRLDYLFGHLYDWRLNPFASSGTIATVLLVILIITGVILLLFYRIGSPYESVAYMHSQAWLGRWLRSVHRYATDLGLIFILFHIFRMWAHGKTWGPRTLAWVSGLIMIGMYAVSTYSGFILVWDRFGLKIAKSGAAIMDMLQVLPNPLSRSFSGDIPVGNSFFFMNLFMHVAIPLGLGAVLWIHTSKLADPKWFPKLKIVMAITSVLVGTSILMPAKLEAAADLLEVNGSMNEDFWFSWWIALQSRIGNTGIFVLFILVSLVGLFMPLIWRPKKEFAPPVSVHDEEKCTGCKQCNLDCPYEAISMVARTKGTGSELVAMVSVADCVGCGICSGSCSQFAIGPTGRTGREQLLGLKQIKQEYEKLPVIHCTNRGEKMHFDSNQVPMPVDCLGNIHPGVVTSLLASYEKVMLVPCEPDCCEMRIGNQIQWERLYSQRDPGLPERIDSARIIWNQKTPGKGIRSWMLTAVTTAITLSAMAWISNVTRGTVGTESFLRMSWRFPIQRLQKCRILSEEELKSRPIHMRVKQECESKVIQYLVMAKVDGVDHYRKTVISPGMRSDRPLLMDAEIPIEPGFHEVEVTFAPDLSTIDAEAVKKLPELATKFKSEFMPGKARLVTLTPEQNSLMLK